MGIITAGGWGLLSLITCESKHGALHTAPSVSSFNYSRCRSHSPNVSYCAPNCDADMTQYQYELKCIVFVQPLCREYGQPLRLPTLQRPSVNVYHARLAYVVGGVDAGWRVGCGWMGSSQQGIASCFLARVSCTKDRIINRIPLSHPDLGYANLVLGISFRASIQ